jgi:hypothetical protein
VTDATHPLVYHVTELITTVKGFLVPATVVALCCKKRVKSYLSQLSLAIIINTQKTIFTNNYKKIHSNIRLGSAKASGRVPKSCLGWVFHFKLGSFSVTKEVDGANARPCLKLKTQAT